MISYFELKIQISIPIPVVFDPYEKFQKKFTSGYYLAISSVPGSSPK